VYDGWEGGWPLYTAGRELSWDGYQ
jgi:hypothetical protein